MKKWTDFVVMKVLLLCIRYFKPSTYTCSNRCINYWPVGQWEVSVKFRDCSKKTTWSREDLVLMKTIIKQYEEDPENQPAVLATMPYIRDGYGKFLF